MRDDDRKQRTQLRNKANTEAARKLQEMGTKKLGTGSADRMRAKDSNYGRLDAGIDRRN